MWSVVRGQLCLATLRRSVPAVADGGLLILSEYVDEREKLEVRGKFPSRGETASAASPIVRKHITIIRLRGMCAPEVGALTDMAFTQFNRLFPFGPLAPASGERVRERGRTVPRLNSLGTL